ncbi:hypothetical protein AMTR_s00026p00120930 [Amborella trichopoda]|uniref:Uncharacterized protein n=1 Tax=Amborella trichopoda TaxID=13333 RepID=W1PRC2_AMBTC|nr:hypothetical protein AMTR_s00026p00120930 [Amborella trichopoda]
MTIESTNELTPAPSSPRRVSSELDPCPEKSAPSDLAEASGATNGVVDEGSFTVQGEELGVNEASEQHEVTGGARMLAMKALTLFKERDPMRDWSHQ